MTGILRSRTRYSSSANDDADNNSSAVVGSAAPPPPPSSSLPLNTTDNAHDINSIGALPSMKPSTQKSAAASAAMGGGSKSKSKSKSKPRSLADLVKSSVELRTEASGYYASSDTAIDANNKNERAGNYAAVISHKPSSSSTNNTATTVTNNNNNNNAFLASENNISSILQLSEDGTPYLTTNNPTTATNNIGGGSGPPVVVFDSSSSNNGTGNDNNGMIAMGVMDEDGKHVVRFCEYDTDGNKDLTNSSSSSSRDRLDQRLGGMTLEEEYDDDDNDNIQDGENDGDDSTASSNDDDDANDEEILRELGLENLITAASENDDGDDGMDEFFFSKQQDASMGNASNSGDKEEGLRSFRILWELLTRWATPSTVDLVLYYQSKGSVDNAEEDQSRVNGGLQHEQQHSEVVAQQSQDGGKEEITSGTAAATTAARNTVDIGASRQSSIMSMIKMCIPRSLSELKRIQNTTTTNQGSNSNNNNKAIIAKIDQRQVENHLATLVQTFDLSTTASGANLTMKQWRGLTTILIAIVILPTTADDDAGVANDGGDCGVSLPQSIQMLNMSATEYRYLTQSAFISLRG